MNENLHAIGTVDAFLRYDNMICSQYCIPPERIPCARAANSPEKFQREQLDIMVSKMVIFIRVFISQFRGVKES